MEIPRAFSSGRRSVSTPVSVLTRRVLPWSMWPAVATITSFPFLVSRLSFLVRSLRASRVARDEPRATRNESLLDALQIEMLQLLHEFLLVLQAAEIHDEGAILDPAYHGHRQ